MPWISAQEWTDFRDCRRRWDYSAPHRYNLEPAAPFRGCELERCVKEALAVFYFPGMWDWPRSVVRPLVTKGFERAAAAQQAVVEAHEPLGAAERQAWTGALVVGVRILETYVAQAPALDHFAPVLVETEYAAPVPTPGGNGSHSGRVLVTPAGEGVSYSGRVDGLVVDEYDAYWILRHRLVERWTPLEELVADPQSRAACWAWSEFYLGMTIAGTIDNELLIDPPPLPPTAMLPPGRRVAQSEGSGGGRSIPQHRRLSAQAMEPDDAHPIEIQETPGIRRVWIRRHPHDRDVVAAGLAADLAQMIDPATQTPPNPSPTRCARCAFLRPCLEVGEGRPAREALATGYRPRPSVPPRVTWSTGRGAAPPRFRGADGPQS